jgi:molybdopterin-containing oxidoreductase family membrane subunit
MAFQPVRRLPAVQFLAAASFMVGIFCARLEFLIAGQRVPLFRGHWAGYVDYWPSMTEWMLVPAGFGLLLLLYGLGNWLLRLGDRPPQHIAAE